MGYGLLYTPLETERANSRKERKPVYIEEEVIAGLK